jgi:hypothetical protein
MNNCDYCQKCKTVPSDYIKTIFKIIKKNKNKNIVYLFIVLNFSYKNLIKNNIFIPYYTNDFLILTREKANFLYFDVGYIKCNLCQKTACPSHFLWSNFYNGKCKYCNKLISVCGWCKKNYCLNCYKKFN